ncbi:MAG: response regulator transcription factor [Bacteroidota bacterium]
MLRILLADDHKLIRNGVRMLLETDKEVFIAAEAENGNQVLELLAKTPDVDIVVTDIDMQGVDGISLISILKSSYPNIKVIMLSMHGDRSYVTKSMDEGADGYLVKTVTAEELIFALKFVQTGEKYICAAVAIQALQALSSLSPEASQSKSDLNIDFTSREMEVLQMVADGFTNAEMSDTLFLSKRTIEGHRQSLIDKTGVRNSSALIKFSMKHGLVK